MYFYHNTENDLVINVEQIHQRGQVIQQFKNKFSTYGYREIHTPSFAHYDLYATMNGTVNHQEMIKTIDNTGQVLVLRPDITIPITQQIARNNQQIKEDLRYSYVLDVFRQSSETNEGKEKTQAGVEYFGNPTPEADAEIIALAIHLLQDLNLENFKIELGHASFFKQLEKEMQLQKQDLLELKQYIQAKNVTEIEQFLKRLAIDPKNSEIVMSLPFLYGKPLDIMKKVQSLPLSDALQHTLQNLRAIYDVLVAYGVADHVVFDLSLINHMDYYSDMIFQGFIQEIGKPILMGGRYNTLASQFGANIPAIGFAFDVDLLLEGMNVTNTMDLIDISLFYEKGSEKEALTLTNALRDKQYSVLAYPVTTDTVKVPATKITMEMTAQATICNDGEKQTTVSTVEDVIRLLEERN